MHLNGMQNSHQNLVILKWKTFSLYKIEMFGKKCALADVMAEPAKSQNTLYIVQRNRMDIDEIRMFVYFCN